VGRIRCAGAGTDESGGKGLSVRREMRGFVIGSLLFALGATPGYLGLVGTTADNLTYFLGSIFFTIAGFTQLRLTGRWQPGGWSSRDDWDDWWAAAIQFLGTIAFNISTFVAIAQNLDSETYQHHVWRPDFLGSIFFLVASALAVKATTHRSSLWDPEARNWWSTWLNMIGSVAFMASAIAAWSDPSTGQQLSTYWVNAGTFIGAICFMSAAILLRPEARRESDPSLNGNGPHPEED